MLATYPGSTARLHLRCPKKVQTPRACPIAFRPGCGTGGEHGARDSGRRGDTPAPAGVHLGHAGLPHSTANMTEM